VRIERFLAAGAPIKGAARKFDIDYHALRRHWTNHVSAEARASYAAGAGATRDQLEQFVADESLGLIDHYRIVRGALYKGFTAAVELGDGNFLALLAGRLHENFRDCGRLTGGLQREYPEQCSALLRLRLAGSGPRAVIKSLALSGFWPRPACEAAPCHHRAKMLHYICTVLNSVHSLKS